MLSITQSYNNDFTSILSILCKFNINPLCTNGFSGKIIQNEHGIYFNYDSRIYRVTDSSVISTENKEISILYRFDIQHNGNIVAAAKDLYTNVIVVLDKDLKLLYKIETNNRAIKDIYADVGFIALRINKEPRHANDKTHTLMFYNEKGILYDEKNLNTMHIANVWIASNQPYLLSPNSYVVIKEEKDEILILSTNKANGCFSNKRGTAKSIIYGAK